MVCERCQGRRVVYGGSGAVPCPLCAGNMKAATSFALFRLHDVAEQFRKGECGVYGVRLAYRQAASQGATLDDVAAILNDDELIALITGADSLL